MNMVDLKAVNKFDMLEIIIDNGFHWKKAAPRKE